MIDAHSPRLGSHLTRRKGVSGCLRPSGRPSLAMSSCWRSDDGQDDGHRRESDHRATPAHAAGLASASLPRSSVSAIAPVYDADAPDPDVIRVGSTYYAYTTGSDLLNIPVLTSTDLQNWHQSGDALPVLPSWTTWGRTWGPGVIVLGSQYVMHYATAVVSTGQQCISEATATSPTGPFVDTSSGPLICQSALGGSIDPQPFVDTNDTPYLYWKSNGGSSLLPASIWAAQLTPDGSALASPAAPLLAQDQGWETTVEGPAMVETPGGFTLFYSGGQWNTGSACQP